MTNQTEADIHFELYRHLANAIEDEPRVRDVTFGSVRAEHRVNGGVADVVLFDSRDRPSLVIEAKRPLPGGGYDRDVDPYSPKVIRQAFRYAGDLGAGFFGTYNGHLLVLFRTFEEGTPLLQRRSRTYEVTDLAAFARDILTQVVDLEQGRTQWDPHHETFITRLGVFHDRLQDDIEASVAQRVEEDEEFAEQFATWVRQQGWDEEEEERNQSSFAAQAAYLLMNKLLFYKLLSSEPAYEGDLPPFPDVEPDALYAALGALFDEVTTNVDFEAVYDHDPIFDEVSFGENTALEITEFVEELESYDLTQFDHDVIGEIYERIIPPLERHDLGQYYTPPGIVSLICRLTVRSADDQVLDPGCGSGGFLVGAYRRLEDLSEGEGAKKSHQELLDQLYGIDINRFPAHLSAINLALRDLGRRTPRVNLVVEDFFHVTPEGIELFTEAAGVGEQARPADPEVLPTVVDAVVGNPPYIRQERIQFKDLCRRHLDSVGASLTKRSDIYAYFFTHAAEFLREGGRLGFITSDAWLNVGYGEGLQDFFLDQFKIKAVVVFNRQVFEDPLVVTCVTIVEKCSSEDERNENGVHLLLVKDRMPLDDLVELIETEGERDLIVDTPVYRSVWLRQGDLQDTRKWGRFLFAPSLYWEILATGSTCGFRGLGKIRRGSTTGNNSFFYFRDLDTVREAGVEQDFVTPLLKHVAETEHVQLQKGDLEWYVLDMHDFVEEVRDQVGASADLTEECRRELRKRGYDGVLAYIENAELRGLHEGATVAARDVWFDLGELLQPQIILTKEFWTKWHTLRNDGQAAIDQALYAITPTNADVDFLLGVLNSHLAVILRELHGRTAAGEAMNRNRLTVYEAESMPVPDPRVFSDEATEAVRSAVQRLIDEERTADEDRRSELQERLDEAVLALFGFDDRVGELQEAAQGLVRFRQQGGADSTEVLVDLAQAGEDEVQEIRLTGARIVNGGGEIVEQGSLFSD